MIAPPGSNAPVYSSTTIVLIWVRNMDCFVKGTIRIFLIERIEAFRGTFVSLLLLVTYRVSTELN